MKGRPRTIRDTPQEVTERQPLLESLLVGWTGSIVTHALIVAAFLFLALVLPEGPPSAAFETELGSAFGDETGLDLDGGFDDELIELVSPDPSALSPEPMFSTVAPGLDLEADRLLSEIVRPAAESGGSGLGGGEFGEARFGEGIESIRGVEVQVGDPQFTLIWDTEADIDLHVIEPGGSHIYWADRRGKRGGELDVDDTDGFGPENIYWLDRDARAGDKVKGLGPPGVYHWYVHYYGGPGGFSGRAIPTRWKVRVKHAGDVVVHEGTLRRVNERSKVQGLRVESRDGP